MIPQKIKHSLPIQDLKLEFGGVSQIPPVTHEKHVNFGGIG